MAKVKLIDVAQRAGVSKSTVSQYLNSRFDYMSKDTKERIKLAISDLNYVPNPIARSLKTDKTKTIGIIVRDVSGFYTSRALRGIDDFCKSSEYNVLIYNTDFDPEVEAKALQSLHSLRVDGIIIASSGKNMALINNYTETGLPIVQFQIEYDDSDSHIILSDYKKAAFDATEYLIHLGHTRICFLTQDFEQARSRNERYQGYIAALNKHDISVDEQLIQYWDREKGFHQSPKSILESPSAPTAFFTQHLAITTELLKELDREKIQIPEGVSLVGFDELPMVEFFKVPITVVRQEPYAIGKEAARLLIDSIHIKVQGTKKVVVPCTLVKRDSCQSL